MTITLTKEELGVLSQKETEWFYGVLNYVVDRMCKNIDYKHDFDKDYRDRCARLIREYTKDHPRPRWEDI